jgi:ubiquinone/menaquinone biosynthesis C-methylase UbiE
MSHYHPEREPAGTISRRGVPRAWRQAVLAIAALAGLWLRGAEPPGSAGTDAARYEWRAEHDPDGTGEFYLGREIAQVMGHQGADWLERPEREEEEQPRWLIERLGLRPTDAVADIGAGTGYLTRRLAKKVPAGKVFAVDIQPEMLQLLRTNMASLRITNVVPVRGELTDPRLPDASLDVVLMVDVYHEFDHPFEMMTGICRALKPGGRVVFVEYRLEDPSVPIKPVHKMTVAQVKKEMSVLPLAWVNTMEFLPRQHVIVFRKAP